MLLFAMHTLAARMTSAEAYGLFALVLAISSIAGVVAPLGLPTALQRLIAQALVTQDYGSLRGALRRSHQITVCVAALFALTAAAVVSTGLVPRTYTEAALWCALLIIPVALTDLRRNALQGLSRPLHAALIDQIVLPLSAIGFLLFFKPASGADLALSYLLACTVAALLGGLLLFRSVPDEARGVPPVFHTRRWLLIGLPMLAGGLANIFMVRGDMVVLGTVLDLESLGLYGAAWRYAILVNFGLATVNSIAGPLLAAAYTSGRSQELREVLKTTQRLSWLLTLPLAVPLMLFPAEILSLFGNEFTAAAPLVRMLTIGQLGYAAFGSVGLALSMTGHERQYAVLVVGIAFISLVAYLLVAPIGGAVGAAMVNALSFIAVAFFSRVLVRRLVLSGQAG